MSSWIRMKNKKPMGTLLVLIIVGVVIILLSISSLPSMHPLVNEFEFVKKTATEVVAIRENTYYANIHKRLDSSFVENIIDIIEIEYVERSHRELTNWTSWINFYNHNSRIFWMIPSENGTLITQGGWRVFLTPESQSHFEKLLEQIGLTDELGPLPLAENIPATTNVVFREETSIPYVIDGNAVIMPNEHFGVGLAVSNFYEAFYDPAYSNVDISVDSNPYYRDDQNYDDWLDIYFDAGKQSSDEHQNQLVIKNQCSFGVRFELARVRYEKFEHVHVFGGYKIDQNETIIIEADPNISCYILSTIERVYEGP